MPTTPLAVTGDLLDFACDPAVHSANAESKSYRYTKDGILLIEKGRIVARGNRTQLAPSLPADTNVIEHRGKLIVPGFVDTHVHFPQCEVIASYGEQLLTWLNKFTFPAERKFDDEAYATSVASFFLDELLRNGTTTALVFATVHPESVNAFFKLAYQRRLRMICGKVMMDRNAPEFLLDTAKSSLRESQKLIDQWHDRRKTETSATG